jgi:predicted RNA-binding protein with PIN domain
MRPVVRGENTKIFKDYKDARRDLIEKLGEYCSYCEMRIPSSLDVEHKNVFLSLRLCSLASTLRDL